MIRTHRAADGTKRYRVTVGNSPMKTFARWKDAQEYESDLKRIRRRERAGMYVERGAISFADLHSLWESNFQPSDWRLRMAKHSLDRWGKTMVRSIQPEGVGTWLHSLPHAEKTKSHILDTLRQILNAGIEWGYLEKSPARPRAFKPPSEGRARPIRPFEAWSEVEAVCAHLSANAAALVRFACATGVRLPGEAVDLTWADVNVTDREVTIHGTKTEAAARTIPLSSQALAAIQSLPRSITGRVFVGKAGGRFDYLNWRKSEWRKALEAAGLEHRTPYECRHTFATLALSAGASLDDVAQMLGHTDITITRRYYRKWIRPMQDRLRGVLDTIGAEKDADDQSHDALR